MIVLIRLTSWNCILLSSIIEPQKYDAEKERKKSAEEFTKKGNFLEVCEFCAFLMMTEILSYIIDKKMMEQG